MRVYLASPSNRHDCEYLAGMNVLISYAQWRKCVSEHVHTFDHVLIDSGAFSELTGKAKVDIDLYREWSQGWRVTADAIAGLDDINGDWRRSVKNYEQIPWGFPTVHNTDPPELIDDLIAMARERGKWIGIGLKPPREGKEQFVRDICDRIPEDFHIHGWALRRYTSIRRIDSVDSTNWLHQMLELRGMKVLSHLTTGECLEIIVKRYQRWERQIKEPMTFPLLEELSA